MTTTAVAPDMALRFYRYLWLHYRRNWKGTIVISVANPLLFLVAIGAGLGTLVGSGNATLGGVSYLAFFAPGMLAAASMQNGMVESAFPVSYHRMPGRAYPVAVSTPLEPVDVLHGHALFMAVKVAIGAAAFCAVMFAFGVAASPLALLALPAATLTGFAFAMPVTAWAVTLPDVRPVQTLFKWVVMPLYLFSGTFFATAQLPDALGHLVALTPLWHGVELCRTLTLGTATWAGSLGHVAYLSVMALAGYLVARRNFRRHLHP
ncbi:ABC transporter permease [Catellatospora bangladeshensis]|uniref:Transport permease protein n=1 Tax=Catellatospora bangladeshensis TaxID=310355 RepID=A0A8J3JHT7_9ACTN|nr:ABC transporter permease [Catellatospora bangladeshensis]GIF80737.1 transport permease protein [Catellatospora bangladeshensis]